MSRAKEIQPIIGIGLSQKEQKNLQKNMTDQFSLKNYELPGYASNQPENSKDPLLAIIPWRIWKSLPSNMEEKRDPESGFFFLKLDNSPLAQPQEAFVSQCIMAVLQNNQMGSDLFKALNQAKFLQNNEPGQPELIKTAEEQGKEKEQSKVNLLNFLSELLSQINQDLDIPHILQNVQKNLQQLYPVEQLAAAFWGGPFDNDHKAQVYLPQNLSVSKRSSWINLALEQASALGGFSLKNYNIEYIPGQKELDSDCEKNNLLTLPLQIESHIFGLVILQIQKPEKFSPETFQILQIAAGYLALILQNAQQLAALKQQARLDSLTGLNNRQTFDQKLSKEIKRHKRYAQKLSLLMLDIDFFKQINDTYGHQAGDHVLKNIGRILTSSLREYDFAARYGGEEFAVILPQTNEHQSWFLAERIRQKIEQTQFQFKDYPLKITMSIGLSSLDPNLDLQPEELIAQADQALYKVKNNGRNNIQAYQIQGQKSL